MRLTVTRSSCSINSSSSSILLVKKGSSAFSFPALWISLASSSPLSSAAAIVAIIHLRLRSNRSLSSSSSFCHSCASLTCLSTFPRSTDNSPEAILSRGSSDAWRGGGGGGGGVFALNLQQKRRRGSIRARRAMDATTAVDRVPANIPGQFAAAEAVVPLEAAADLVPEALVWAALNGLVVGDKALENSGRVAGVGLVHAPLSLLPTPFPAEAFHFAVELSTLFNDLVDKVSQDADFLQQTLSRTKKADEFTARLLAIHSKILEEGVRQAYDSNLRSPIQIHKGMLEVWQDIRLGLHRSDYMLDVATSNLLQVELNTISSSFAGLGSLVSGLHKYLLSLAGTHFGLEMSKVPENKASDRFAAALALAWKEYGNKSAAILMIVQPQERNMYDQQWLGFKLKDLYGVRVLRRTLTEVLSQAKLSTEGILYIGKQVISIVYYRGGYTPDDYPSETEWEARLLLERSAAIKCPSISYHLTGAKKIQQELAKPGVLERFLQDAEAISTLRKCFAGLWSLEGDGSETILEKAINAPNGFVLKPQREGGGNNIYGKDVASRLSELRAEGGDGLAAYILMQRIFPAVHTSFLLRGGSWSPNQTISELGIFGAYLRNGDKEILNEYAGHLLRTKVSDSNEGGVAAGFAVLDSPYLS